MSATTLTPQQLQLLHMALGYDAHGIRSGFKNVLQILVGSDSYSLCEEMATEKILIYRGTIARFGGLRAHVFNVTNKGIEMTKAATAEENSKRAHSTIWRCSNCGRKNMAQEEDCIECMKPHQSEAFEQEKPAPTPPSIWRCRSCQFENPWGAAKCCLCTKSWEFEIEEPIMTEEPPTMTPAPPARSGAFSRIQAFPTPAHQTMAHSPDGPETFNHPARPGMDLRDYFAARETLQDWDHPDLNLNIASKEALAGRPMPQENGLPYLQWEADWRAALKYLRADAMMKARAK